MGSSIKRNDKSSFLHTIIIGVITVMVFFSLPKLCTSHVEGGGGVGVGGHQHHHHPHSHDHHDHHYHHEINEPASFKYSRQANENLQKHNVQGHEHGHQPNHQHHDDDHDHHHSSHNRGHPTKVKDAAVERDISSLWLHSMGSTLLISAAPYFVLFTIRLDNTEKMKPRLKVLLAFASGGLLGDAFLHLIPHSAVPHHHHHHHEEHSHQHNHNEDEHGHDHSHDMSVGLWVLSGIITFLAVEKTVRLIKGGHGHSHGGGDSGNQKEKDSKKDVTLTGKKNDIKNKVNKTHTQAPKKKQQQKQEETGDQVEVAGYLNLAADFAHNFTDGLAIGASYLAGRGVGIITTITILFHEIPHEIGDYAILIKSGCSRRKAMFLQLVTALGALAGTALALLGAGGDASASWVLPFTAGGFIYIATVSVLPELLEGPTKLGQSLREISALLTGVALMVVIANFE